MRLVKLKLVCADSERELTALLDTGNRLREPVSGGPVLVAGEAELLPLLSEESRRVFSGD